MNQYVVCLCGLLVGILLAAPLPALADPGLAPDGKGVLSNQALGAGALNLPSLGEPVPVGGGLVPAGNGGLQLKGSLDGDRYQIKQDFTNPGGALLGVDLATQKIPATTVGWLVSAQPNKAETVMNMGWRFGGNQQLMVSAAQLRAAVDADPGSRINPMSVQHSGGLDYRVFLGNSWLSGIDVSGYTSSSPSQSTQDSQDHLAGTSVVGLQLGLEASPVAGSKLKIGVGTEHIVYDSLSSTEPVQNLNTSVKWSQVLWPTVQYSASVAGNSLQRNVATGVDINLSNGQQLGVKLARTQFSDGQLSDHGIEFSYTLQFGNKFKPFQSRTAAVPWSASLVPEVLHRPSYLPETVLSRPDSRLN